MDAAGPAFDFKTLLEGTCTRDELIRVFSTFLASFGVTAYSMGELTNPHQPKVPLAPVFATKWPPEWESRWMSQNYLQDDPVLFGALYGPQSFYWREIRPPQRGVGTRIMDEGAEFGLRDGYCIPIHRPRNLPAAVSIAGDRLELSPAERGVLQLCSIQVFDKLEQLMRPSSVKAVPRLSHREREAMHWIAAGKSIPAIAEIVGLSDHTVRGYVKTAMRKLNATTHAQAVAIAIRIGELLP